MAGMAGPRRICAAVVPATNARFELREVSLSAPHADEIVVQLEASGMCHADIAAQHGGLPFPLPGVLGHEGVGHVVEAGTAVGDIAIGDRVVLSFAWCGRCESCERGSPAYCDNWFTLNLAGGARADGSATLSCGGGALHGHFFGQSAFASHVVVAARAAVKVPEGIPADILAPLGCGVQTGVGAVVNVLKPRPAARVAIYGAGAVGLSAIMGLALTGAARIIAIDVHRGRLDLARELGATDLVDATTSEPVAQVAALVGHAGLNGAIETSGNPSALRAATAGLAGGGTCVVVGVPHDATPLTQDVVQLVARGIRIVGTNQGDATPRVLIPQLVELYQRGRLPIDRLVRNFPFAEINQAAEASLNGSVVKPVLMMA